MAVAIQAGETRGHAPKAEKHTLPQPPERATTTYKKAEVIRARGKEINESFSVQQRTERVLAERVQNFILTLQDSEVSTRALSPWQKQFLEQFRGQYPNFDDSKLQEYALKFVQTQQGLVAALKIAEWEMATYQRATGAYIEDIQSPIGQYRKQMQTAGREAPVEQPGRFLHRAGRTDSRAERDKRMMEGRPVREKDGNYYFQTNVGLDRVSALGFTRDAYVAYDFSHLDAAQKTLLARRGLMETAGGRAFNGEAAEVERGRIAELITSITQARVDVYEATGRQKMDLNMINRDNTAYLASLTPFLRIEERALLGGPVVNVNTEVVKEIKLITADFAQRATDELLKRQAEERHQQVSTIVDKQIAELGQTRAMTPAEQTRLDDLTRTIPLLEQDLAVARRPQEITDRITDLTARRTTINGQVNGAATAAGYAGANFMADLDTIGPSGTLTLSRNEMVRLRTERETQLRALREQLSHERNPAQQVVIRGQITTVDAELKTAWPPRAPTGINNEVSRLEADIAAIERVRDRPDIKPLIDESTQLSQQIGTERAALIAATNAANDLLTRVNTGRPPALQVANIAGLVGDITPRLDQQRMDRQAIEAGSVGRERQRLVLEVYRDHVLTGSDPDDKRTEGRRTSVEGMNNRAQRLATGGVAALPLEYSADYQMYPEQYLRAIQIMFGTESIRPGSEALFQQVTRMLTPEMVLRVYNEVNGTAVTNYAGLPPNLVSPAFLTRAIGILEVEATNGRLGQYSDFATDRFVVRPPDQVQAVIRPQFQRIRAVSRDAAFNPNLAGPNVTERDRLAGILFHYDDLDDLTRRIVNEWNVGGWAGRPAGALAGGVDYFNPATAGGQAAIAEAKRFAEEIDRVREWKRKLHAPAPAPATPSP